jgi:branched-subunit amino acid aminotransferase/4-amino-4-deoxychorismate lyase
MGEYEIEKPEILTIPSRAVVLECLEEARRELHAKVKTGRIKNQALEKARNEKIRLLIYCCSTLAGILKDRDLDELHERISRLEQAKRAMHLSAGCKCHDPVRVGDLIRGEK